MTTTAPAPELVDVLANRRWLHRTRPFHHVVARGVFTDAFYAELAGATAELLAAGLSDTPSTGRFSRGMTGYDAYGLGITHDLGGPFSIFLSPQWRDVLSDQFAVGHTPYVFAGAHHHLPGGRTGFLHNDYNPVWFPRATVGDERLPLPDPSRCDFKTGAGTLHGEDRVEPSAARSSSTTCSTTVGSRATEARRDCSPRGPTTSTDRPGAAPRSTTAWSPSSARRTRSTPSIPTSSRPRTSLIMWVHRTIMEAYEKFGADQVERWK